MGIKKKPGPYRMNQEHLLPKFAPAEKSPVEDCSAPSAGPCRPSAESAELFPPAASDISPSGADAPKPNANRQRHDRMGTFQLIASRISRALTGRRRGDGVPSTKKRAARPVQGELSLNTVKVVRNDLEDSDLEIGPRQSLALPSGKKQQAAPTRPIGIVWNRLSARLLRQAAQEFNSVQKQRGKLLSQSGHDGGGAYRT